jgi:taspase (threonine aspartase 1)
MNILLAVHAGAGSYGNDRSHRKTLLTACRNAVKSGIANDDSLEACVKAVQVLELSSATNAAIGSNLTIDGTVECDAAVMQSTGMQFASVGAVSTVRNPIRLAQKLLLAQANDDGYLVRPTLLVGCGAEQFARQVGGIEMIADSRELITTRATDEHSMALIRYRNQKLEDISTRLDTVGGVSIGRDGRAFAAVSSGGLLLKHCGRV